MYIHIAFDLRLSVSVSAKMVGIYLHSADTPLSADVRERGVRYDFLTAAARYEFEAIGGFNEKQYSKLLCFLHCDHLEMFILPTCPHQIWGRGCLDASFWVGHRKDSESSERSSSPRHHFGLYHLVIWYHGSIAISSRR